MLDGETAFDAGLSEALLHRLQTEMETHLRNRPKEEQNAWMLQPASGNLLVRPLQWDGVVLGPHGSPYQDGVFHLKVEIPPNYPMQTPLFTFFTRIFHPLVPEDGPIDIGDLCETWSPDITLRMVMQAVVSMMKDPYELDGPNEEASLLSGDPAEFDSRAREWTRLHAVVPTVVLEMT
eukprot:TRINITY_DN88984_c0_g1_i1.p1 TRINITY_DN88984_c0_g1~~TRINITY_DN88984_c0_g1_i1.p1  ORF type:complete len:178 (-),score=31.59 TRINITY_DN88984_c0_g1_i1:127-660(-)